MMPLFHPGDGLIVDGNITFRQLCRGDVISFFHSGRAINIVHRIVRVAEKGFVTQGDNCSYPDSWYVKPEMAPVLVTAVRRGAKTYKVHGGRIGTFIHHRHLLRRSIRCHLYPKAHKLLSLIADTNSLSNLKLFDKKLEVKRYKTGKEVEEFLFMGKRKIGYRLADKSFHIRVLWRLFIDPDSNPGPGTKKII